MKTVKITETTKIETKDEIITLEPGDRILVQEEGGMKTIQMDTIISFYVPKNYDDEKALEGVAQDVAFNDDIRKEIEEAIQSNTGLQSLASIEPWKMHISEPDEPETIIFER